MAIDDNTSYELTGAQVKDLANKIKAKAADNIFVGATNAAPGSKGLVPAPQAGDDTKYLKGDGTWGTISQYTPTVFYIDNSLPRWDYPSFIDVHVYKDSALTETATLQELYDAIDAGGVTLVYDASTSLEVYGFLYAFHSPRNGDPDSVGDYMYFANDNTSVGGTVLFAVPQGQSTNDAAILTVSVAGLYAVGVMRGATSSSAGMVGLVPAPAAGDEGKALHGDGTWKDTTAKLVEMSYGESNAWAKFISAYNAGSIVYCRASSNSDPGTGTQGRKAFMAYVNNATTPTEVEFQYVRSVNSKTDSQQCDQVFIYKLTNASGGTWTVTTRNMAPKINVSGPITKTFTTGSNATVTIGANTMTGATSGAAGTAGVVPAPAAGSQDKFLRGDGTWAAAGGSNGRITLYTSPGLDVYDPGDTITLYKDAAETQPITTLQELGALVDSGIVVIRNRSNQDWTLKYWDDDSTSGWYGIGVFVADGGYDDSFRMVWDPTDGNVLKMRSVSYYLTPSSYSTSEAATSEKWIDGKRIYRKTVDTGALPNSAEKLTPHNISNLYRVIKLEGYAYRSTDGKMIPLPFAGAAGGATTVDVSVVNGNIRFLNGADMTAFAESNVTLYYTKSS